MCSEAASVTADRQFQQKTWRQSRTRIALRRNCEHFSDAVGKKRTRAASAKGVAPLWSDGCFRPAISEYHTTKTTVAASRDPITPSRAPITMNRAESHRRPVKSGYQQVKDQSGQGYRGQAKNRFGNRGPAASSTPRSVLYGQQQRHRHQAQSPTQKDGDCQPP